MHISLMDPRPRQTFLAERAHRDDHPFDSAREIFLAKDYNELHIELVGPDYGPRTADFAWQQRWPLTGLLLVRTKVGPSSERSLLLLEVAAEHGEALLKAFPLSAHKEMTELLHVCQAQGQRREPRSMLWKQAAISQSKKSIITLLFLHPDRAYGARLLPDAEIVSESVISYMGKLYDNFDDDALCLW